MSEQREGGGEEWREAYSGFLPVLQAGEEEREEVVHVGLELLLERVAHEANGHHGLLVHCGVPALQHCDQQLHQRLRERLDQVGVHQLQFPQRGSDDGAHVALRDQLRLLGQREGLVEAAHQAGDQVADHLRHVLSCRLDQRVHGVVGRGNQVRVRHIRSVPATIQPTTTKEREMSSTQYNVKGKGQTNLEEAEMRALMRSRK